MKTFKEFICIAEESTEDYLRKQGWDEKRIADFMKRQSSRTSTQGTHFHQTQGTYSSSGSAGQGVQDAARQAQQRTAQPPARPSGATPPKGSRFRMPNIPRPTAGQAAVGALNVGLGALEYKQRRDVGQTRTQAGAGAVSSAAGGQAGWMLGAKGGAALGSQLAGPRGALIGGALGGITGSVLGSSGASALSDKLTGVTPKAPTEKDFERARQRIGTAKSRQVASKAGVYGATKGSLLTGLGGPTKVDQKAGTFTTKGKTVKLPSTQLIKDPKTGKQVVGDLAYKGGKPVYLARASVASRDVGLGGALRNISRATGIGGQRQRDIAAAKQEYRTALKGTQAYTKGLGISTQSATKQGLPGYSKPKK